MVSVVSGRVPGVLRASVFGLVLSLLAVSVPQQASAGSSQGIAGAVGSGLLVGIACWAFAVPRGIDEPTDSEFARKGPLVGVQGSYVWDNYESTAEAGIQLATGMPLELSVESSFGAKARAGYRCHPRLAAAAQVEWVDGFDADVSLAGTKVGRFDVDPIVVTSDVKGYLLTGRYQPFLLAGGGVMTARVTASGVGGVESRRLTGFAMRLGGGLDFYATKSIVLSLGVDYVLPFGNVEDFDYVSLGWGLEYRF